MSETTLKPQVRLCCGANAQGKPCGTPAQPESDYCYRHDPGMLAVRVAELPRETPKALPDRQVIPGAEALSTAEGLHQLLAETVVYTLSVPNADLARVHATNGTAAILLRNLEQRRLEQEMAELQEECKELDRRNYELEDEVERLEKQVRPPEAAELSEAIRCRLSAEARLREAQEQCTSLQLSYEQCQKQLNAASSRLKKAEAAVEALLAMQDSLCLFCITKLRNKGLLPPSDLNDLGRREPIR